MPLLPGSQDLSGDLIPAEGHPPQPNVTGNIAKWVAELAEFKLDFVLCHAVKSQVLADFIVDWTPSASPLGGQITVSQSPELRSSLDPTGLFSSTAPRVSRGPARE
jgi:hypothetical protein